MSAVRFSTPRNWGNRGFSLGAGRRGPQGSPKQPLPSLPWSPGAVQLHVRPVSSWRVPAGFPCAASLGEAHRRKARWDNPDIVPLSHCTCCGAANDIVSLFCHLLRSPLAPVSSADLDALSSRMTRNLTSVGAEPLVGMTCLGHACCLCLLSVLGTCHHRGSLRATHVLLCPFFLKVRVSFPSPNGDSLPHLVVSWQADLEKNGL